MAELDVDSISDDRLIEMVREMGGQVPRVALELADRLEDRSARLRAARRALGTDELPGILDGTVPVDTVAGVAQQLTSYAGTLADPRLRALLEELAGKLAGTAQPALTAAA